MSLATSSTVPSSALEKIYSYPRDVLNGTVLACEKNKQACQRFLLDIEKSKDPAYPWRFDETIAVRPIEFMERFLTPTKGNYDRMEPDALGMLHRGEPVRLGT